jgi:hypothetical protein
VIDDAHPRRAEEDPDVARLRIRARLHDGVIPVPFLGTTWQQRGAAYWRRRSGAFVLLIVLTAFAGAIAAAFTGGIIAGVGHQPAGVAVGIVYALVAVPGFVVGRRRAAKAPLDSRAVAPRTALPSGCLAFVSAPFSVGLALAVVLSMFGHDFMGEGRAREVTGNLARRG